MVEILHTRHGLSRSTIVGLGIRRLFDKGEFVAVSDEKHYKSMNDTELESFVNAHNFKNRLLELGISGYIVKRFHEQQIPLEEIDPQLQSNLDASILSKRMI